MSEKANLSEKEIALFEHLTELGSDSGTVRLSLRDFNLRLKRKKWFFKTEIRKASHMTIKRLLEKLQSKGLITLDYSEKSNPRIIINE